MLIRPEYVSRGERSIRPDLIPVRRSARTQERHNNPLPDERHEEAQTAKPRLQPCEDRRRRRRRDADDLSHLGHALVPELEYELAHLLREADDNAAGAADGDKEARARRSEAADPSLDAFLIGSRQDEEA